MNCVFDSVFRVKVKVKAWIGYRVHPIYTYMYSICIHTCMYDDNDNECTCVYST